LLRACIAVCSNHSIWTEKILNCVSSKSMFYAKQYICYVMAGTSYFPVRLCLYMCFVLNKHAELDFNNASLLEGKVHMSLNSETSWLRATQSVFNLVLHIADILLTWCEATITHTLLSITWIWLLFRFSKTKKIILTKLNFAESLYCCLF
jgi:hypothetical protein